MIEGFRRMGFFQNTCEPQALGGKIMVAMMNIGHAKMSKWGFSHLSAKRDGNVLDIGCGGGANVARWLGKCKIGNVTGLDYSKVSVDKTKKRNKNAIKHNRCQVIQGNVAKMPFKNEVYDYVSAFETIYFWPDLDSSFAEVFRVLKKDGIFMICNESDGTNMNDEKWMKYIKSMTIYNASQLKNTLNKVGFSNIKIYQNRKSWMCIVARK